MLHVKRNLRGCLVSKLREENSFLFKFLLELLPNPKISQRKKSEEIDV